MSALEPITGPRLLVGKVLSHALNPVAVNVPFLAVFGLWMGIAGWGESFVLVLLSTVVPMVYTVVMLRFGVFSNIFISRREERIYFLPVILATAGGSLWLCLTREFSALFTAYFLIATVHLVFASVLTFWYKVSLHLYGIASLSVFFCWYGGPEALWTLAAVPLCAAGRLMLREHTLGQVVLGSVLGLVLTPLMLALTL